MQDLVQCSLWRDQRSCLWPLMMGRALQVVLVESQENVCLAHRISTISTAKEDRPSSGASALNVRSMKASV